MIAAEPAAAGSVVIALPGHEGMPARGAAGVRISDAIEALIATKQKMNYRPAYIKGLAAYLRNQFAKGREDWTLESFHADLVEKWFDDRGEKPLSPASNLGKLSALFQFAVRRQWLDVNPARCLEKYRLEHRCPVILTPHQCALVMDHCRREKPGRLAFFALALYVGVRPDEIARLRWSDIRMDEGDELITVDAAASKIHRRRTIRPHPTAIKWLKLAKEKGAHLPVARATRKRYLDGARAVLGLDAWPQDVARHSAASYLLALHEDAGRVACMLGNSERVLQRSYKQLVSTADCAAFWSFGPESPRPERPRPPLPPDPVKLNVNWGVTIRSEWSRFRKAEAALAAESTLRVLARERQRRAGYFGAIGQKMEDADRMDTLREMGKLSGCSKQTLLFVKAILAANPGPDVLDKLREGKLSIHGTFQRLVKGVQVRSKQVMRAVVPDTSERRRGASNDRVGFKAWRKALGKCIICSKPLAGHSYCEEHLANAARTAKARGDARVAAGKCSVCGEPRVTSRLCAKHTEMRRTAQRNRRRRIAGIPVDAPLLRRARTVTASLEPAAPAAQLSATP